MKTCIFTICCFWIFTGVAQEKLLKKSVFNRVIINTPDSTTYAQTLPLDKKIQAKDDRVYYWYKSDQVRSTRGGYDGRLLHGEYKQFYANHNLKEKGNYKKGLRTGKWKFWYPNGELEAVVHYKNGKRNGKFEKYSTNNLLLESGHYRNDKVVGKVHLYDINGKEILIKKDKGVKPDSLRKNRKKEPT